MKSCKKPLIFLLSVVMLLPSLLLSGCAKKYDAVMEYHGIELTEDMYYYWMSTFKRNILAAFDDAYDTEDFWQMPFDEGRTVEEYFTEIIHAQLKNYLIAQHLYKTNRLTLDSSVKKAIAADIEEKIDYYGGRSKLNEALSELMLNIDSLEKIYTWEEKYDTVYQYLFGEGGELTVSDAALIEYYEKNYSRIRYIVFYTTKIVTDENGNQSTTEMTEEELAETMARIEECQKRIDAGEDFATLQELYSEYDTSSYPNGFFVSVNELDIWGGEIIGAVQKAEVGQVCRVEEEAAVFFVEKCTLTSFEDLGEQDTAQLSSLLSYATTEVKNAFFDSLAVDITIDSELLDKYRLSTIAVNPYYGI